MGQKRIPITVLLKKKLDEEGKVHNFKAKFVCQGFRQVAGVDFDPLQISSSVSRQETLRIYVGMCATLNLTIHQYDVSTAILNSTLDKPIYVRPPKDLLNILQIRNDQIWKLKKTVYGLKQSNKEWVNLVKRFMINQKVHDKSKV